MKTRQCLQHLLSFNHIQKLQMKKSLFIIMLFITQISFAQNNRQNIRGVVTDKLTQSTLPGATVQIINSTANKGTITDTNGNFVLPDVVPDRYEIKVSYIGYQDAFASNVVVTSGKEVVLDFKLGYTHNSRMKKPSQSFSIDLQNITDNENVFSQSYDARSQSINTTYQLGFFPNFIYKIQF